MVVGRVEVEVTIGALDVVVAGGDEVVVEAFDVVEDGGVVVETGTTDVVVVAEGLSC